MVRKVSPRRRKDRSFNLLQRRLEVLHGLDVILLRSVAAAATLKSAVPCLRVRKSSHELLIKGEDASQLIPDAAAAHTFSC